MTLKKIDKIANLWNKTKDPYYKDLWYKKVRRWAHGRNGNSYNSLSVKDRRNLHKRGLRTFKRNDVV